MKELIKQLWFDLKNNFKNRDYILNYKFKVCLPIFIFLLILDFFTKKLVFYLLSHDLMAPEIKFIDGFINFKFIVNKGIIFGANANNLAVVITSAVLITLILFIIFLFINNKIITIAFTMIITGGVGNLIDRMWNNGGVVDFLAWILFSPYSIFNLSDTWITFGIIILIIDFIIEIIKFYREQSLNNREEHSNLNV